MPGMSPPASCLSSVCHLQVYAQGMSVAAVSAVTLERELAAVLAAAGSKAGGQAGEGSLEACRAAVQGMGPALQKRLAAGERMC